MVWGQESELCKTSPETWHPHLVISVRVGDRNHLGSALCVFSCCSPKALSSWVYYCLQSYGSNGLTLECQQLMLFKMTLCCFEGIRAEVRRPEL